MPRKTILLMSRGRRLHHVELDMVANLARDHRVVVLTPPEFAESFASIKGVKVKDYRSWDIAGPRLETDMVTEDVAREQIASIERELGLRLFKSASNYLLYRRIVREFGGNWDYLNTEAELVRTFVDAYRQLAAIFEEEKPDVVFFECLDRISTFIALALALKSGIFAFDVLPSPLGEGKGSLSFGIFRKNVVLEHLVAHPELIEPEYLNAAEAFLDDPRAGLFNSFHARVHRQMLSEKSAFSPAFFRRWMGELRRVPDAVRNLSWHLRPLRNRLWLRKHVRRDLPDQPYIAFPMSHSPEATTCSQAPRWVNQNSIVEQLAINAPSGMKIVVKEHPRTYGRRGPEFFGGMADLPNVHLCHPSVDNLDLVSGAEAVVVVTGTTGFEGMLLGTPVGVLGRPYYADAPGVTRLNYPEEIFDLIDSQGARRDRVNDERIQFMGAYLQSLYDFGAGTTRNYQSSESGEGWASALRGLLQFIATHDLSPSDFESGLNSVAVPS